MQNKRRKTPSQKAYLTWMIRKYTIMTIRMTIMGTGHNREPLSIIMGIHMRIKISSMDARTMNTTINTDVQIGKITKMMRRCGDSDIQYMLTLLHLLQCIFDGVMVFSF